MLESRYLTLASSRVQPVLGSTYNSRVKVYRKIEDPLQDENSLDTGETPIQYKLITRSWPCTINYRTTDLVYLPAGETELGSHIMTSPIRYLSDGGLIVRTKDILEIVTTQERFLVVWSYDPMVTRVNIIAGLKSGVVDFDPLEFVSKD